MRNLTLMTLMLMLTACKDDKDVDTGINEEGDEYTLLTLTPACAGSDLNGEWEGGLNGLEDAVNSCEIATGTVSVYFADGVNNDGWQVCAMSVDAEISMPDGSTSPVSDVIDALYRDGDLIGCYVDDRSIINVSLQDGTKGELTYLGFQYDGESDIWMGLAEQWFAPLILDCPEIGISPDVMQTDTSTSAIAETLWDGYDEFTSCDDIKSKLMTDGAIKYQQFRMLTPPNRHQWWDQNADSIVGPWTHSLQPDWKAFGHWYIDQYNTNPSIRVQWGRFWYDVNKGEKSFDAVVITLGAELMPKYELWKAQQNPPPPLQ